MRWIIGIDEVGRGALAGPVVVAVAAFPKQLKIDNPKLGRLKDSKKLSKSQREVWAAYLTDHPNIYFALAKVYPRQIERRNISGAANLAAARAFSRIHKAANAAEKIISSKTQIFLDGGLFLGNGEQPKNAKTVIRGDEKITAIKSASIVAKVYRDRLMRRLAKRYPGYGFEIHKGYGTKKHRRAIRKYGPSPAHRLTFLPKTAIMRA